MHKCTQCGAEWETNYCPACARTIDRSAIEAERAAHDATVTRQPRRVPSAPQVREARRTDEATSSVHHQIASARNKLVGKLVLGIALATVGLVISIASFEAAESEGGGRYVVTYGLVVAGVLTTINALIGFAKIAKIERTIREGKQNDRD